MSSSTVELVTTPKKKNAPPHVPTDESRERVKIAAGMGLPQDVMARGLGISDKTLREHYRFELDDGYMWLNEQVANTLVRCAMKAEQDPRWQASLIFFCKARMGYTDRPKEQTNDGTKKTVYETRHPSSERDSTSDKALQRLAEGSGLVQGQGHDDRPVTLDGEAEDVTLSQTQPSPNKTEIGF